MSWEIRQGDALERLREMSDESVQCVVTSPPYWGLRDYGTAAWEGGDGECDHRTGPQDRGGRETPGGRGGSFPPSEHPRWSCRCGARRIDSQLGLEPTPEQYVVNLVAVFREVRRVLRKDGTVWLNLGDSYASSPPGNTTKGVSAKSTLHGVDGESGQYRDTLSQSVQTKRNTVVGGLKPKDLVGIPWSVAFALRADGWWLRSDIIWSKPNPMPESVTDRPTRAHEYLFLLTKSARYFYDADAVREENSPLTLEVHKDYEQTSERHAHSEEFNHKGTLAANYGARELNGRNRRSVWEITTQPYPEAHFATFPPKLVEPCILAGTSPKACGECGAPWERATIGGERVAVGHGGRAKDGNRDSSRRDHGTGVMFARKGGISSWRSPCCGRCEDNEGVGRSVVLDPFAGSGTTGLVALRHDRSFIGIELSPQYCELARRRITDDAPLLNARLEVPQADPAEAA